MTGGSIVTGGSITVGEFIQFYKSLDYQHTHTGYHTHTWHWVPDEAEKFPASGTPTPDPPAAPDREPTSTASLDIGGVTVTRVDVQRAIDILTAAKGTAVTAPLTAAAHPLAAIDHHTIAKAELALYPAVAASGKAKTKNAVIHHLRRALDDTGPFVKDADGYCTPLVEHQPIDLSDDFLRARVSSFAKAYGNGRIIGRGRSKMSGTVLYNWLWAWGRGDLKTAYDIEAAHTPASPYHPGAPANPTTHRVIWAPAVPGETPAGVAVPGDWPSPNDAWTLDQANNYLLAANAQHVNTRSNSNRIRWAKRHAAGHKDEVDAMSRRAAKNASIYTYAAATTVDLPALPGYQEHLAAQTPVKKWGLIALRTYAADNDLTLPPFWEQQVNAVTEHLNATRARQIADATHPRLVYAPDQPTLSGFHRKAILVDQHSRTWIFKPAPTPEARFRPEVEHEAHILARRWGYRTAESRLVEFDGHYGQIQAMLPVQGNLLGYTGAAFATLTRSQLVAIAKEHLLDWVLDNDDTHGENIVILTDGAAVGIDKGRAWRYFGAWDGLSATTTANSNAQLVYTALYQAIAGHHLDRDTVDAMYRAVIIHAHTIQRDGDDFLRQSMGRALANRPHYRPSTYQPAIPDAPQNADELIAAATTRKNRLVTDMHNLWQRVYAAAGWTPPDPTTPACATNPQGHPIHTGLHSPDLHHAISLTKSYGTPTFVAGRHIEDAHILLWRERRPDGQYNIRGQFKIRDTAYKDVRAWCRARASNVETPQDPVNYTVIHTDATRAAAHQSPTVRFASDGELQLDGTVLTGNQSQPGGMYLITLDTGEEIEFRGGSDTATPLSTRGLTQFTIPDATTLAQSLHRIQAQLQHMGCPITAATGADLELFYWRHLAGILADRADTRPNGPAVDHSSIREQSAAFWARAHSTPTDPHAEIAMWRHAFAAYTDAEHIDEFVTRGGHLPRFLHLDLRRPTQPCGKPHWERFDVTDADWRSRQMVTIGYGSGPTPVIHTGAALATEARIRTLAIWKHGQSSFEDMHRGSAGFVFARLNQEKEPYTLWISPHVLRRTSTYAFHCDHYGGLKSRPEVALYHFDAMVSYVNGSNEVMIKDAVSFLDDIEICSFVSEDRRLRALVYLAELGITEIRGVPLATRFVVRYDGNLPAALKAVRETYVRP